MPQNAPECTPEHLESQKFPWGSMPPDLPRVNGSRVAMFSTSANIGPPRWKKLCTALKWCPYKGRGVISTHVCASNVINGPASADQGHSTPSQGSWHVHHTLCQWQPTSPIPPFLLVQNLSSKCQLITCEQKMVKWNESLKQWSQM